MSSTETAVRPTAIRITTRNPSGEFSSGTGTFVPHNPKMIVDESVLYRGAALYAYCAARYLDEHRA